MAEKLGLITGLMLFAIFGLPLALDYYVENVKTSRVLNASGEFQQLLIAEGEITERVRNVVDYFGERGLIISLRDENGNVLTSVGEIGQTVYTTYQYDNYKVSNSTVLTKR